MQRGKSEGCGVEGEELAGLPRGWGMRSFRGVLCLGGEGCSFFRGEKEDFGNGTGAKGLYFAAGYRTRAAANKRFARFLRVPSLGFFLKNLGTKVNEWKDAGGIEVVGRKDRASNIFVVL